MSEEELSVRLDWQERSTVPFRPSTDETMDAPALRHDGSVADRLAHLERSVGDLQKELARLRAEIARVRPSSTPPDASAPRRGAPSKDRPRPIRVRATPRTGDAG